MDNTNVLLFGIAVILLGGFITVAEAAAFTGSPFDSGGYTILIAGFGICVLGPLANRYAADTRSD